MNLNKMFKLTNNEVCGLDIGTSAVKIVALRKDNTGYTVTAAGISQIAQRQSKLSSQIAGQGTSETSIIKAVQDCLMQANLRAKGKIKTKLAVCGVSGPEVAVRDFEFPPLPDEEISGAVFFEASLVCPFNLEQAEVDYQIIQNGGEDFESDSGKARGILVAATNNLLATKVQLVKDAGLKCVLMDVDGLALLNCFNNLAGEEKRATTAMLNVGGSCTTLAAMSSSGWPFIRDINCAGNHIVDWISKESDIEPTEIIKILFDNSSDQQTELGDHLEKACNELVANISETLRFYAASEKSTPVDKIFACGGFAPAKGFIDLLGRRLGIEVCLWNPFEKLRCNVSRHCKDIITQTGPAMAVATGLAMRSIEAARRQ